MERRDLAQAPSSSNGIVAALNSTWFGAGLPAETQARLAAMGVIRSVPAGRELIHEGDIAEEFGLVLAGRIALRMLVPERGMVTVLTVEPGDIIGWSAIVPPYRSTSTVVAIEPARGRSCSTAAALRRPSRPTTTSPPPSIPGILQRSSAASSATRAPAARPVRRATESGAW